MVVLVALAAGRPNQQTSSSSSSPSSAPREHRPAVKTAKVKAHHKGKAHKKAVVHKGHDRNIDRQGNVMATLQAVNGNTTLNQENNNQQNKNKFMNSINQASNGFLNAKNSADNVVAGLQAANGTDNVDQMANNNKNTDTVKNKITAQDAQSIVSFDAADTSGKAMEISGTNAIDQATNNDDANNQFSNM